MDVMNNTGQISLDMFPYCSPEKLKFCELTGTFFASGTLQEFGRSLSKIISFSRFRDDIEE